MLVAVFLSRIAWICRVGTERLGAVSGGGGAKKSPGLAIFNDIRSKAWPARLEDETHCRIRGNKECLDYGDENRGSTYELENDKEKVVHDERPLPPVAVSRNTEYDGTNGPEHQHERDAPCDVRR